MSAAPLFAPSLVHFPSVDRRACETDEGVRQVAFTLDRVTCERCKANAVTGTTLIDDKRADRVADGREAINDMLEAQGKS